MQAQVASHETKVGGEQEIPTGDFWYDYVYEAVTSLERAASREEGQKSSCDNPQSTQNVSKILLCDAIGRDERSARARCLWRWP
eukprot:4950576-Amphidinium_carterae.1